MSIPKCDKCSDIRGSKTASSSSNEYTSETNTSTVVNENIINSNNKINMYDLRQLCVREIKEWACSSACVPYLLHLVWWCPVWLLEDGWFLCSDPERGRCRRFRQRTIFRRTPLHRWGSATGSLSSHTSDTSSHWQRENAGSCYHQPFISAFTHTVRQKGILPCAHIAETWFPSKKKI